MKESIAIGAYKEEGTGIELNAKEPQRRGSISYLVSYSRMQTTTYMPYLQNQGNGRGISGTILQYLLNLWISCDGIS